MAILQYYVLITEVHNYIILMNCNSIISKQPFENFLGQTHLLRVIRPPHLIKTKEYLTVFNLRNVKDKLQAIISGIEKYLRVQMLQC